MCGCVCTSAVLPASHVLCAGKGVLGIVVCSTTPTRRHGFEHACALSTVRGIQLSVEGDQGGGADEVLQVGVSRVLQ